MLSNDIFLQNFVLIQPITSPPKICKIFAALVVGLRGDAARIEESGREPGGREPGGRGKARQACEPGEGRGGEAGVHLHSIRQTLQGSFSAV